MKRFSQFLFCMLIGIPLMAQPPQGGGGKQPPMGDGPRREGFPKESEVEDHQPINASFRFALLSDLHISDEKPQNAIDLDNAINDINTQSDLAFVLVSGDVTDDGQLKSFQQAKQALNKLRIPYYVVPGNHDTQLSESAITDFEKTFGDNKFRLFFNGYLFLGINTGPLLRHNDGHIAPQDLAWLNHQLKKAGRKQPVYIISHYPLKNGDVDNWEKITDMARKYNTQGIFCGHYHRNAMLDFDAIPGLVSRSTLRGNDATGGYTVFDVGDSLYISEKRINNNKPIKWQALPLDVRVYTEGNSKLFPRPNYDINKNYKQASLTWKTDMGSGIYGAPLVTNNHIFVGDENGKLNCLSISKGKPVWQFKTAGRIMSSPVSQYGKIVFTSCDNSIYCLNAANGGLIWRIKTDRPQFVTPLIEEDMVYVGGSDGIFRAINLESGSIIWTFAHQGYQQEQAAINNNTLIFSTSKGTLYALNKQTGDQLWTWTANTPNTEIYSITTPPLISHEHIYVTSSDHTLIAIDANNGQTIWTSKTHKFIPSIGLSEDKNTLFARNNKDSVFAIDITQTAYQERWSVNANYGHDQNPCLITVTQNQLLFATKNGLISSLNTANGTILWQQKIGNTGVNQIIPVTTNSYLITTLDGTLANITIK